MANAVTIEIQADSIEKVATAVFSGEIKKIATSTSYLGAYRKTGEAAPTLESQFSRIFQKYPNLEPITSYEPIDVYVFAQRSIGKVEVSV